MDYIMLKCGKVIVYGYDLCYDGIIVTAREFFGITKEEKEEFESKLRSERDLVKLYWAKAPENETV